MLDILAKIFDEGGCLKNVVCTLHGGDETFITAVGLTFESLSVVFRAMPDDDTLGLTLGRLESEPHETLVDVGTFDLWAQCLGLKIHWAWQMTNQQGYSDGVRLEFGEPGGKSVAVVEMVVLASAIYTFVASTRFTFPEKGLR